MSKTGVSSQNPREDSSTQWWQGWSSAWQGRAGMAPHWPFQSRHPMNARRRPAHNARPPTAYDCHYPAPLPKDVLGTYSIENKRERSLRGHGGRQFSMRTPGRCEAHLRPEAQRGSCSRDKLDERHTQEVLGNAKALEKHVETVTMRADFLLLTTESNFFQTIL